MKRKLDQIAKVERPTEIQERSWHEKSIQRKVKFREKILVVNLPQKKVFNGIVN